jgi:hypothetical protein
MTGMSLAELSAGTSKETVAVPVISALERFSTPLRFSALQVARLLTTMMTWKSMCTSCTP